MRVEIKSGGDGVLCWNREAIQEHAASVTEHEGRLGRNNPDLVVKPGRISCYGCEVMEYDYGTKCTARLTKTLYAVEGEIAPRADDAKGSLAEIPGLLTRAPERVAVPPTIEPVVPEPATAASGAPGGAAPKRTGLRNLFGR